MKVLYYHQYFSTPLALLVLAPELARALVEAGHEVVMVCLRDPVRTVTGLDGAFSRGKRSGIVDGIKVIEFNLSYTNNDTFLRRSLTFLHYSWKACSWLSVLMLI